MKIKRTQQEWHNEFVEFWSEEAVRSVKDAIKFYNSSARKPTAFKRGMKAFNGFFGYQHNF